ncbi:oligodendrocyte-myelin glycoprotein [Musca domestica]|uniref:Oligodendrocyte-myelin glycoprotein n=1 Tax=Musca domestica TaxID=7370 RepID=A0A1I8MI29_MUSDO|nr:oligodendrocyte-myelin glycoprotein [Musca domestica]
MHISYKFGLFLIFIISLSFCHTRAAPAQNQTSTNQEDYPDDDYDEYYDDTEYQGKQQAVASPPSSHATATSTAVNLANSLFNLFSGGDKPDHPPQRSNHVVEPVCPKSCLCLEDFKYIDCSNGRLTEVPHDLPNTAVILDLSHNRIKEIKPSDFSHRLKLQEINLSNNLLENVTEEMFEDLPRLQRLRLSSNLLTAIEPDTFRGASDLSLLDLSNNPIHLPADASFLNQPSLLELNCRNCSWREIYEDTFKNTPRLTALRIDNNDFNKKINTRAFIPLKSLIKLRVPELDQKSTEELCNLLKFIDNISFKRFEVSCYELVLGATYNESIILVTDPPYRQPTSVEIETSTTTTTEAITASTVSGDSIKSTTTAAAAGNVASDKKAMASSSTTLTPEVLLAADNETEFVKASVGLAGSNQPTKTDVKDEEEAYKVPISQEAINQMLIGLMIISVIGIIIGVLCRKDVWGMKTKCCRTKKPEENKAVESNGQAPEEIPLNKLP